MTSREKTLLGIFAAVLVAAGALLGAQLYLERLARLDADFITLQKRALQAMQSIQSSNDSTSTTSSETAKRRFYASGPLPDPLILAKEAQDAMKNSGLRASESRIIDSSNKEQWILYRAEGSIDAWFRFLLLIRDKDPQTLFRSLSIAKKEGLSYAFSFEVGHAIKP